MTRTARFLGTALATAAAFALAGTAAAQDKTIKIYGFGAKRASWASSDNKAKPRCRLPLRPSTRPVA